MLVFLASATYLMWKVASRDANEQNTNRLNLKNNLRVNLIIYYSALFLFCIFPMLFFALKITLAGVICLGVSCLAFAFFCSLTPLIQRKRELWAWCFAVVYAMTDEIHQLSVPGRAGRFTDVCIDATGAAIGIILLFLIRKIWQTCCEKRKHLIQ